MIRCPERFLQQEEDGREEACTGAPGQQESRGPPSTGHTHPLSILECGLFPRKWEPRGIPARVSKQNCGGPGPTVGPHNVWYPGDNASLPDPLSVPEGPCQTLLGGLSGLVSLSDPHSTVPLPSIFCIPRPIPGSLCTLRSVGLPEAPSVLHCLMLPAMKVSLPHTRNGGKP